MGTHHGRTRHHSIQDLPTRTMGSDVVSLLRMKGLKATPHRTRLLHVLDTVHSPLTFQDIFKKVRSARMDAVTIYRNLEAFVQAGLAEEVRISGESASRFERKRAHHHHAVCTSCNKVEDLPGCGYEKIVVPGTRDFPVIKEHIIEFRGLCRDCAR